MPDSTAVKLGVAFDLNGKAIVLQPKEAISAIQTRGIELTLPERLDLDSAGSAVDSILAKLGSTYRAVKPGSNPPTDVIYIRDKIPNFEALTEAYDYVTNAQLHVDKFHAKIPGSETKKADGSTETEIKYTIGVSATWDLVGSGTGLTLTGIYFEISNEPAALAAEAAAATV